MMGGGFGGCVIAAADAKDAHDLCPAIKEAYRRQTGMTCGIYSCQTTDGAGEVVAN
jgi:galactokinase